MLLYRKLYLFGLFRECFIVAGTWFLIQVDSMERVDGRMWRDAYCLQIGWEVNEWQLNMSYFSYKEEIIINLSRHLQIKTFSILLLLYLIGFA